MPIGFMDKVINCFIVKGSIERARLRLHDFKSCMARFDATPLRFVGSMTAGLRLLGLESSMAHFDATSLRRNSEFVGFDKLNHRAGGVGSLV